MLSLLTLAGFRSQRMFRCLQPSALSRIFVAACLYARAAHTHINFRLPRMAARTRHGWLLVVVLVLGIATLEAPEMSSLADDVSNDAVTVSVEDLVPRLTSRPMGRHEISRPAVAPFAAKGRADKSRSWLGPSSSLFSRSCIDLLLLLSTQKK
jgi:hypothetical protein